MNTQIIEFLKSTPNSNKTAITAGTGIKGLPLFNMLKKMLTDKQITSQGEGNETTYSIGETQTEEVVSSEQPTVDEVPQSEVITEETEVTRQAGQTEKTTQVENITEETGNKADVKATITKATTSRDNTKYIFEKETYGKGKLVVACLKKWIADNPSTSYKQLKEIFSDTLMKRFGVFEEIKKAKEISGTRDRYFFKPDDIIKLADKKQVVVCSQWTAGLISEFIKTAKANGLKIKEA